MGLLYWRKTGVKNYTTFLLLCIAFLVLSGCASQHRSTSLLLYSAGDYDAAEESIRKADVESDILANLYLGSILHAKSDYAESIQTFDKAELLFKAAQEDALLHDTEKMAYAVLLSDSAAAYTGKLYEFSLVNIYKSINFLLMKDFENARVEVLRALDRQRRAADYFEKEIQMVRAAVAKEKGQALAISRSRDLREALDQEYGGLNNYSLTSDFTNPFITYFSALFFLLEKDYATAADLFKELKDSQERNTYVLEDLAIAEKASKSLKPANDAKAYVWVIFENGAGTQLTEKNFNLPIFLRSGTILVSFALPKPVRSVKAVPYLTIESGSKRYHTQTVANTHNLFMAEFEARFDAVLMRALVNSATKVATQAVANETDNALISLVANIFALATANADVRYWPMLPASYDIAKVPLPADGRISLDYKGAEQHNSSLDFDTEENHVLFVNLYHEKGVARLRTVSFPK